uniref:Large ribosomal subunit protein mL42 n=1 Tax=Panagrellus redivivus TaxID=6233 RepID=A0A7E4W8B4_PANRE
MNGRSACQFTQVILNFKQIWYGNEGFLALPNVGKVCAMLITLQLAERKSFVPLFFLQAAIPMRFNLFLLNSAVSKLATASRQLSSKFDATNWSTVVLKNGSVAAWHPEAEFPFKYTRPIDLAAVEVQRQEAEEQRKALWKARKSTPYKRSGPDNLALRNIFHTGKTEFNTRPREDRLYATAAPIPKRKR